MISITRGRLEALMICCDECEHSELEGEPVWIDSNNDTYFAGRTVEELLTFIGRHNKDA